MKKIVSLLLLLALLSGCSGAENETVGKVKDISAVEGIIRVVTDRTDADELFAEIEEKFIQLYPEVEDIIWESSSDYDTYIRTRMNTTDYGDVLFVPFSMKSNPSEYQNYFYKLGTVEELEEKYLDVTESDYNSIVYGLPVALNTLGIIYNERVFSEAGISEFPTSLEEMIEVSSRIKESTGSIPFYTNYTATLPVWAGAMTSYGGEQYKSEMLAAGTAFQEGQPIREIMDMFYELSSNALIEEDPITGSFGQAMKSVANGDVAMFMMGSQEVKAIQSMVEGDETISIAPFPVKFNGQSSIPVGAPAVIGINKNTTNLETSVAFLEFIISEQSGYAKDIAGLSPLKADMDKETKELFETSNIILTVPTETPETDEIYSLIANEVGVGRLTDVLQKTINMGLYPDQYETYEEYINDLEDLWAEAVMKYDN